MPDRMSRFNGDQGNEYDFPIFKSSDVSKASDELKRYGTARSIGGKAEHVSEMVDMSKIAQSLSADPPMTSDMINNSRDYEEYMRSSIDGSPLSPGNKYASMKKEAMFPTMGFGGMGGMNSGSVSGGIPSFTDPLNSPTRWNVPTWDERMPREQQEALQAESRSWCDWYDHNHPIVPVCLDIYAKYPFVGMDLQAPDPRVEDEYRTMFFDHLDYNSFLPLAARQFWKFGEAPILGEWNVEYGGWTDDELVNPNQISVLPWYRPGKNRETYLWYPPQEMIELIEEADMMSPIFPSMLDEFGDQLYEWAEGHPSELSSDVFSLLRNNKDINGTRGYPLLMRAFSTLMKEEKLNLAVNAIADRLYTPLMIVKLGSKDLIQGKYQWMPTTEQMKQMQNHLEMMMLSKYRMMVYHAGIEFENPFAGQQIPDLSKDFDRATKEIMGVFGIPQELIYGGSQGTYASGALSAEIMMQNLATTQQIWSRWWIMERAAKVADARGYYEVERKGKIYTKPLEEVMEYDEYGNKRIRRRRKRMLPTLRFKTMDWNTDEAKARGLADLRRQFNIPITNERLVGYYESDIDLKQESEKWMQEQIEQYENTQRLGPAAPMMPGQGAGGMGGMPPGRPGGMGGGEAGGMAGGRTPPGAGGRPTGPGGRPPISDNQRGQAPTPADVPTPGQSEPVLTSLEANYITVDNESNTDNNSSHKNKMAALHDSLDHEKLSEMVEKTAEHENMKKKSSYADEHAFTFIRKNGRKSGVTYYMQGNSLRMSPSD